MVVVVHKVCTSCETKKDLTHFYKDSKGYYESRCKPCRIKHNAKHHAKYRMKNKEKNRKWHKEESQRLKLEVFDNYGHECVCCGEDNLTLLTIDHVNGDGAKLRKKFGRGILYRWLKRNGFPKDLNLRTLCHNCNFSFGKFGYCPHNSLPPNIVSYNHIKIPTIGKDKKCVLCQNVKDLSCFYRNGKINGKQRYRPYCKECSTSYDRERRNVLKLEVFNAYGDSICKHCGETHVEFLSIDHINGGGTKHREEIGHDIYPWLKKNNFPIGYQVLCMNCQVIKRSKKGEHRTNEG